MNDEEKSNELNIKLEELLAKAREGEIEIWRGILKMMGRCDKEECLNCKHLFFRPTCRLNGCHVEDVFKSDCVPISDGEV